MRFLRAGAKIGSLRQSKLIARASQGPGDPICQMGPQIRAPGSKNLSDGAQIQAPGSKNLSDGALKQAPGNLPMPEDGPLRHKSSTAKTAGQRR